MARTITPKCKTPSKVRSSETRAKILRTASLCEPGLQSTNRVVSGSSGVELKRRRRVKKMHGKAWKIRILLCQRGRDATPPD